jgi:hypothetical protein
LSKATSLFRPYLPQAYRCIVHLSSMICAHERFGCKWNQLRNTVKYILEKYGIPIMHPKYFFKNAFLRKIKIIINIILLV